MPNNKLTLPLDRKGNICLQMIKFTPKDYCFTLTEWTSFVYLDKEELSFIKSSLESIQDMAHTRRNLLYVGYFDSHIIQIRRHTYNVPDGPVDDDIRITVTASFSNALNKHVFKFTIGRCSHIIEQIRQLFCFAFIIDIPEQFNRQKLLVRATIDLMASRDVKEELKEKRKPKLSVASFVNRELGYRVTGRRINGPKYTKSGLTVGKRIISSNSVYSEPYYYPQIERALSNRDISFARKLAITQAIEEAGDLKNKLIDVFQFFNQYDWFEDNVKIDLENLDFLCSCLSYKVDILEFDFLDYKEAYTFIRAYLFGNKYPKEKQKRVAA